MSETALRILLVEDNPGDADLLQEMLAQVKERLEIAHVESLRQAAQYLEQGGQVDAVLLDLGLPDSMGIATLERANAAAPHLPIVVLTGLEDEDMGIEAVRKGAQDYLVKGQTQPRMLMRVIHHAIERKRLEKALRRSEERLRQQAKLLEHAPVLVRNLDHEMVLWNAGMEAMFGFSSAEALGKVEFDLLQTRLPRPLVEIEAALYRDGRWEGELHQVARDGRRIVVACLWMVHSDVLGNPAAIIEVNRDITEHKRREEQVATLTRLYAMLSQVNEAIVRARDAKSLYSEVCRIVAEQGGFPLAWIGQTNGRQVVPMASWGSGAGYVKEIRVEVEGRLGNGPTGTCIRENRAVVNNDFAVNPATSPWREAAARYGFRASAAFPLHRKGEVIGALTLYAADANAFDAEQVGLLESLSADLSYALDALEHEQLRVRAEEALRESEQRFRTMADSIPQLAWMAQPDGHIFWYNRRWYEYTGTTMEQMEGWGWQSVHDPDALPRVVERWKDALAKGKPWEDTFPLRRHDGAMRPHLSRAVPIYDQEARVTRWFGTNTDITERIEMEEALQNAKEAADAANVAKSQFLANMSHELRTPMNAIMGMIDVALPKTTDPTLQDCLQTARGSADLLLTLLNDVLDTSKIESGKLELESAPFSLRRMLDEIAGILSVRASEKGLCCYRRMPEDMPDAFLGDRMRLQQVLLNLAGNAIKFTERGEVEISLRVVGELGIGDWGLEENKQPAISDSHHLIPNLQSLIPSVTLEFAVRDTGIGIPPSSLEMIFQPFVQADVSMARRFGGTGLGLSICKHLVELMGGRIWVESQLGKGSTFYFTVRLPVAKELPADFEIPVAIPAAACAPLHILLAEDNPANQKLASYILHDRGHLVDIAGDGQEALRLTEQNHYDVILMDVQMPIMDGLDATAAIRKREAGCGKGDSPRPTFGRCPPGRPGGCYAQMGTVPFSAQRVPIIAMTAHAMKGDRDRCLAAGMDGYISKPICRPELIELVERLAGKSAEKPNLVAATSSTPPKNVFDLDEALKRSFDREMFQSMVEFFFAESAESLKQMRAALDQGDSAAIAATAHRLRGTVVYLGAAAAHDAAHLVEQAGMAGNLTAAAGALTELEAQIELLKLALAPHRQGM